MSASVMLFKSGEGAPSRVVTHTVTSFLNVMFHLHL